MSTPEDVRYTKHDEDEREFRKSVVKFARSKEPVEIEKTGDCEEKEGETTNTGVEESLRAVHITL